VATIRAIHTASRETYGSPRVHAELRLGHGMRLGRKRVERLMRTHGIVGVHRRRRRGCTVRDATTSLAADRVQRQFTAEGPDDLWVSDITQHRTRQGWVYCTVVLDAYSRRVVGWSIADHLRTELVVDALEMACLRRRPAPTRTALGSAAATRTPTGCCASTSPRAPTCPSATAGTWRRRPRS